MNADSKLRLHAQRLALILLLTVAAIVTHAFSITVGRAPALAFDDSLAGISANVAREGRLGFDAIPVHTLALAPQHENFFNYGPWYFLLGGALDWFFGTSYEVHRAAHLLGVMACIVLAAWFFKDQSRHFGAAVFGCAALLSFHYHQWPMVRPDIIGVVGSSLALVAARSLATGARGWAGFAFGFSVGLAITNHPIVAFLLPWSFAVLAAVALEAKTPRGRAIKALLLPWMAGLAVAGASLVIASGFRLGAILNLYFLYPRFIQKFGPTIGFFESINRHLTSIGLASGTAQALAFGLLLLFLIDVATCLRRSRSGASLTLLPGSAWVAYLLSLGVFRNSHEGYAILIQMLFLWTATAWIFRIGHGVPLLAGLLIPATALFTVTSRPGRWEPSAAANVPYREYIDAVRADIPVDAPVQGEAIFGLGRPNWVEMAHAAVATRTFKPDLRLSLTPDYLVISEREWTMECLRVQAEGPTRLFVPDDGPARVRGGFFNQIPWLFRDGAFLLLRVVWAPPYGPTLVYGRGEPEKAPGPRPQIAVWSEADLWQRSASDIGTAFLSAPEDLRVRLVGTTDPRNDLDAVARSSWVGSLNEGVYLIEVVQATPARQAGCVVATSATMIKDLGQIVSATPRLPRGLVTHQVVRHRGGPLSIGLLSPDPAEQERVETVTAFKVSSRRIPALEKDVKETYPAALLRCLDRKGKDCLAESPKP